ncbi:MAG: PadR family transcriptional regulator [Alphaproteobacteria bacterium]|nr:PadR family transcriptional regulator [Alphaproteobacteria bacterium]
MNVRTLCLALLFNNDASGYEIRKASTEGGLAYFVEASFGSIYPALGKLEEEELVTSRIEAQEGRPAKKVYSITEAGRNELLGSLFHELDPDVYRSEFLLFALFAPHLPRSLVETRLRERMAAYDVDIANIEKMRAGSTDSADLWVLNFGKHAMQVAREYLSTHMHELVALARPEHDAKAAE